MPEPDPENLERLRLALLDLGARKVGAVGPQPVHIPPTGVLELDTDAGGIDIHLDPAGAAPYRELRSRALELQLETTVLVAGLDDLIAMKRASARPIDRSDIIALTEPDPHSE